MRTPAAAIIVSSDTTTARLGTGSTTLGTTGDVDITATHAGSATSTAMSVATGSTAAEAARHAFLVGSDKAFWVAAALLAVTVVIVSVAIRTPAAATTDEPVLVE